MTTEPTDHLAEAREAYAEIVDLVEGDDLDRVSTEDAAIGLTTMASLGTFTAQVATAEQVAAVAEALDRQTALMREAFAALADTMTQAVQALAPGLAAFAKIAEHLQGDPRFGDPSMYGTARDLDRPERVDFERAQPIDPAVSAPGGPLDGLLDHTQVAERCAADEMWADRPCVLDADPPHTLHETATGARWSA